RLQSAAAGQQPDLQEARALARRRIEFAVVHAGSSAHALQIAWPDHRAGAQAVLVLERALGDPRKDLHVAVAVRAEALRRRDQVVIDDAQRAESHVFGIVVLAEGKRVRGVEPTQIKMASFSSLSQR